MNRSALQTPHRAGRGAPLLAALVAALWMHAAVAESTPPSAEEAGHAVGSTLHQAGRGAWEVGREIGHGAAELGRNIGVAVRDAAITVGHAARDGSRALVRGLKGE